MNQAHQQQEWFTPAEAATYLRVKTRTVLMWARTGQLKAYVI